MLNVNMSIIIVGCAVNVESSVRWGSSFRLWEHRSRNDRIGCPAIGSSTDRSRIWNEGNVVRQCLCALVVNLDGPRIYPIRSAFRVKCGHRCGRGFGQYAENKVIPVVAQQC